MTNSRTPYPTSVLSIMVTLLTWALIVGVFAVGILFSSKAHAKTSQDLVVQTRQCFANARDDVLKEQQCREAYLATKRSTNAETLQKIKHSESYQQGADKRRQLTGSQQ